jgi:nitric oxide reductase subunit B
MDVLKNGYWHARGTEFLDSIRFIEWLRLPGDLVFIALGVLPLLIAAYMTWRSVGGSPQA